jgi:hypothetical protein
MAQYPQNSPEIQRLIRLSEESRAGLSHQAAVLRQRFDVPARVRHCFGSHPAKWLGATLALGLATSLLLRRKAAPPRQQRRGWRAAVFALALSTARPILKAWLTRQLQQFVVAQLRPNSLLRTLANNQVSPRHPGSI